MKRTSLFGGEEEQGSELFTLVACFVSSASNYDSKCRIFNCAPWNEKGFLTLECLVLPS